MPTPPDLVNVWTLGGILCRLLMVAILAWLLCMPLVALFAGLALGGG